jgi:hypothetical protein
VSKGAAPASASRVGYHCGFGASLRAALEARFGPATLAATWRGDGLGEQGNPDPTPGHVATARLAERWSEAGGRAAWRLGLLELSAEGGWRRRWSRADDATRAATERSLGVAVGLLD